MKSKLVDTILQLLNNNTLSLELRENISKLANTDADKKIAEEILKYIKK